MDLEVNLGAGTSEINLSRIDLTSLRIKGGLGETTLHLPQDMGVRVDVNTGLGTVNASGLEQNGSTYTNAAFGESAPIPLQFA